MLITLSKKFSWGLAATVRIRSKTPAVEESQRAAKGERNFCWKEKVVESSKPDSTLLRHFDLRQKILSLFFSVMHKIGN